MPANFDLNDLRGRAAVHLDWRAEAKHDSAGGIRRFEHCRWRCDRPPSAEQFNDVVRAAGRAAKDSMKVEVPFEQVAPAGERILERRQRQGAGRADRPGRCAAAAAGAVGQGHVAAFAGVRQDGLRQVDVSARADHERGAVLQPGRGRVLSDRLQEGRRIQDVCDASPAACAGDRDRERARIRPERAGAARRRAAPPRRFVPRGRRAGLAGLPQSAARRADAAGAAW